MRQLLFLPGAGADPAFWEPVGRQLPTSWNKRYLAWPGLGANPACAAVRSFDDLVSIAEREFLHLSETGSCVDLISQSMGGALALTLALNHPQLTGRLVLCATSLGIDVEAWGALDWRPEYRAEYPNSASWLYDARPDYSSRLAEVSAPTLLIWGDADSVHQRSEPSSTDASLTPRCCSSQAEPTRSHSSSLLSSRKRLRSTSPLTDE